MKSGKWFRRFMCGLLAAILLAAMAAPALAVGQSSTLAKYGDTYYVVASRLNVRSSAAMTNNVIRSIKKGTKVTFLYESAGWWYVRYGSSKKGFVDKQFLTRKNVRKTGTYKTTAYLNVRSEPKEWSTQIGWLGKGAKLKVTKLNGDWVYINYKGHKGWVAAKYLKK